MQTWRRPELVSTGSHFIAGVENDPVEVVFADEILEPFQMPEVIGADVFPLAFTSYTILCY